MMTDDICEQQFVGGLSCSLYLLDEILDKMICRGSSILYLLTMAFLSLAKAERDCLCKLSINSVHTVEICGPGLHVCFLAAGSTP